MDRTERFYKITQLLEARKVVSREELLEALGPGPGAAARLERRPPVGVRLELLYLVNSRG